MRRKLPEQLDAFSDATVVYEWTDPRTDEVHRCPARFMRVIDFLGRGRATARRAATLLRRMGEAPAAKNQRHLRKAVFILQGQGTLIVSERSTKGGYFIPTTWAEVEQHCRIQELLAASMLANVERLRTAWRTRDEP